MTSLQWRHNERNGVSSHQPHDCLLNRLFGRRSTKTSKLCVTGLCAGNSPATSEFPAQIASNAEDVSIGWRHHAIWEHDDLMVLFNCLHFTLSHYHHYADLIKRIQYIKPLYKYELPSMCLKLCLFSQLSFMQHMEFCFSGGCFRFKRFSFDDCENICISAYYHHHKIKSMNH